MPDLQTEWLAGRFPEVTPREFYRYIFPAGELDERGAMTKGKYTGVVCRMGKDRVYRYTLTDDLDAIDDAVNSEDFCICRPLSYAGKSATAEHARMLYAIAVDVDKLHVGPTRPVGLSNLWERHIELVKRIPKPTFIVSSGSGVHLYYVLDNPMPLYRDVARELQEYKRELTRLIWHDTIVNIKSVHDIQQEGIYQGFRMPGTVTKKGGRVRAFQTGERVSFDYLNSFAGDDYEKAREAAKNHKKTRLAAAAVKWPDWYERRVLRGEKRGAWAVNRAVYDWWKGKIIKGAAVGHRYYCCMMLAIYAQKCGRYDEKHNPNPVTQEELERDIYELLEPLEKLTDSEDNHFGLDDIQDALEAYQDKWITYPRTSIEYRTGISIPANKRNGQKQADHLEEARAVRDIRAKRRGERWDAHNGRKSEFETVQLWRGMHPDGRKSDCIRETGLSKPTVYKHWDPPAAEDGEAQLPLDLALGTAEERSIEDLTAEIRDLTASVCENATKYMQLEKMLQLVEAIGRMPDGSEKDELWADFLAMYDERWRGMFDGGGDALQGK